MDTMMFNLYLGFIFGVTMALGIVGIMVAKYNGEDLSGRVGQIIAPPLLVIGFVGYVYALVSIPQSNSVLYPRPLKQQWSLK